MTDGDELEQDGDFSFDRVTPAWEWKEVQGGSEVDAAMGCIEEAKENIKHYGEANFPLILLAVEPGKAEKIAKGLAERMGDDGSACLWESYRVEDASPRPGETYELTGAVSYLTERETVDKLESDLLRATGKFRGEKSERGMAGGLSTKLSVLVVEVGEDIRPEDLKSKHISQGGVIEQGFCWQVKGGRHRQFTPGKTSVWQ